MNKYIILPNQKLGKLYAGETLPDNSILVGVITTPKGKSALLQLANGNHVRFNDGYITEFITNSQIVRCKIKG